MVRQKPEYQNSGLVENDSDAVRMKAIIQIRIDPGRRGFVGKLRIPDNFGSLGNPLRIQPAQRNFPGRHPQVRKDVVLGINPLSGGYVAKSRRKRLGILRSNPPGGMIEVENHNAYHADQCHFHHDMVPPGPRHAQMGRRVDNWPDQERNQKSRILIKRGSLGRGRRKNMSRQTDERQ